MEFEITPAELDDKHIIADLFEYCYDYPKPALNKVKETFGQLMHQYFVGKMDGKIIAALRCLPLEQNIRGTLIPMGGIANVVSAPEYRSRGHITSMMRYMFNYLRMNHLPLSTLYPFKNTFYLNYGYLNLGSHEFVEINPAWLHPWKNLPKGYKIIRKRVKNAIPELQKMQEKSIRKFNGGVKRPEYRWNELYGNRDSWVVLVYNPNDKLEGAMHFHLKGFGHRVFGENNIGSFLRVEFHALTLEAHHALFHFIYLNRDQINIVDFPRYPSEFNYTKWLSGYTKIKHKTHMLNMGRIIDIEGVLKKFPLSDSSKNDFEIFLKVNDDFCPWNAKIWHLEQQENQLKIEESTGDTQNIISIQGLTGLLYGRMTVEEIEYFDWLSGISEAEKRILQSWFSQSPYCNTEFF